MPQCVKPPTRIVVLIAALCSSTVACGAPGPESFEERANTQIPQTAWGATEGGSGADVSENGSRMDAFDGGTDAGASVVATAPAIREMGPVCPSIGCSSVATFRFYLSQPILTDSEATIRVCKNRQCFSGLMPVPPQPSLVLPYADESRREEAMSPKITISTVLSTAGSWVEIAWVPWISSDFRRGDSYRVAIESELKGALFMWERGVDYSDTGVACALCRSSYVVE